MSGIRKMVAVVAGVVAAGGVIALTEMVAHDRLAGDGPFVGAVVSYGLGSMVGTAIATVIAFPGSARLVPMLLGVLALINLLSFPHPLWFVPAAAFALFAGWFAGARLAALGGGRAKRLDDAA